MKTLDDFVKNNTPNRRKSALEAFSTEIMELYAKGFKVEQIHEFLKANSIKISKRRIWDFIAKSKTSHSNTQLQQSSKDDYLNSSNEPPKKKAFNHFLSKIEE